MEVPYNIGNFRREKCVSCATPCEYQYDLKFRMEGENRCPINKWMKWTTYVRPPRRFKGAGDIVAAVADPIAKVLDYTLKTKVSGCGACRKRREQLNKLLPFN